MIYFVSGHVNLTKEEFEEHYIPVLDEIIKEDSTFVMGDADGADVMTQLYLNSKGVSKDRVTVYYRKPRNNQTISQTPQNPCGFPTRGPFNSHPEKDAEMTRVSDKDIAWVRDACMNKKMIENEGKIYDPSFISGTEANILRRHSFQ